MTPDQVRRARARAQRLLGPDTAPDVRAEHPGGGRAEPAGLVRQLLAVQAQDFPSARLALRARGVRAVEQVHDALTGDRSLVVSWFCRGTLHLVAAEDHGWLLALTAPTTTTANQRRLRQEGITPGQADTALQVIRDVLGAEGPLGRAELAERLLSAGVPARGQAVPHLLLLAALGGLIVLGPVRDGAPVFALTGSWLPGPPPVPDRDAALAVLVRRYLTGHGPATEADLAAWSGLPLRDVRAGVAGAAEIDLRDGLLGLPPDRGAVAGAGPGGGQPVRLLPSFDPWLLGWRDRALLVQEADYRRVYPGGGIVRATVIAGGRAVGTWGRRRTARGVRISCELFRSGVQEDELRTEAQDVARFEGAVLERLDVVTN